MPATQTTAKAASAVKALTVTGKAGSAPARPSAKPAVAAGKSAKPVGAQAAQQQQQQQLLESFPPHQPTFEPRLGLARVCCRRLGILKESTPAGQNPTPADTTDMASQLVYKIQQHYMEAIALAPRLHDAYIELAQVLEHEVSLEAAADLYARFPFVRNQTPGQPETSQDDLYIESEITRMFMKLKRYRDPVLVRSMISEGREMGIGILSKHMETLDAASENKTLMEIYAGVSRKAVDDVRSVLLHYAIASLRT
ncbi:hypothetical protein HDU86_004247 [Geranomyces michiganensis]|nr:hypothetical protein HDU86_004247 [Geranomyces michiganensis]